MHVKDVPHFQLILATAFASIFSNLRGSGGRNIGGRTSANARTGDAIHITAFGTSAEFSGGGRTAWCDDLTLDTSRRNGEPSGSENDFSLTAIFARSTLQTCLALSPWRRRTAVVQRYPCVARRARIYL